VLVSHGFKDRMPNGSEDRNLASKPGARRLD
jgi:hypothetical protein